MVAWVLVAAAAAREAQEQILRGQAEEQRGLVQRLLYFSHIRNAGLAWNDNQMSRMEELLQEKEVETRRCRSEPDPCTFHASRRVLMSVRLKLVDVIPVV